MVVISQRNDLFTFSLYNNAYLHCPVIQSICTYFIKKYVRPLYHKRRPSHAADRFEL